MDKYELFEKHKNFAYFMIKKYFPEEMRDEDIEQTALLGLWKSCITYDESKGVKFSTYAARVIENEINMIYRSRKKEIPRYSLLSINEYLGDEDSSDSYLDILEDVSSSKKLEDVLFMRDIQSILTDEELEFLLLHLEYTTPYISELKGKSYMAGWRYKRNIINKLKRSGVIDYVNTSSRTVC